MDKGDSTGGGHVEALRRGDTASTEKEVGPLGTLGDADALMEGSLAGYAGARPRPVATGETLGVTTALRVTHLAGETPTGAGRGTDWREKEKGYGYFSNFWCQ